MTLRQLVRVYDARLIESWDHTAAIVQYVFNLNATVNNLLNKKKIKPVTFHEVHPLRKDGGGSRGLEITPDSLGGLKGMLRAMAGGAKVGRPRR